MEQFRALLASIFIEILVIFVSWKYLIKKSKVKTHATKREIAEWALVISSATLLTHPFAWHSVRLWTLYVGRSWLFIFLVEIVVSLFEAFVFCKFLGLPSKKAIMLSFLANASSFLWGIIKFYYL